MSPANDDFSLGDFVSLLMQRKVWVIALTLLGIAAGVLFGVLQQPVYRAETLLSPVTKNNDANALAGIAQQVGGLASALNLGSTGSNKEVAIAVLRSRSFIFNFVRTRGIDKVLFEERLDPNSKTWDTDKGGAPSENDIYDLFSKSVFFVREDNKSGLVTVSVEWTNPKLAAKWANELVKEVNSQLRARAKVRAENSIDYLESEVEHTGNVEAQRAIYDLIGHQINEIMLANVTEEYAFQVIDPAIAPDVDDYVRPRKVFLAVSGTIAGFILAVVIVTIVELGASIGLSQEVRRKGE